MIDLTEFTKPIPLWYVTTTHQYVGTFISKSRAGAWLAARYDTRPYPRLAWVAPGRADIVQYQPPQDPPFWIGTREALEDHGWCFRRFHIAPPCASINHHSFRWSTPAECMPFPSEIIAADSVYIHVATSTRNHDRDRHWWLHVYATDTNVYDYALYAQDARRVTPDHATHCGLAAYAFALGQHHRLHQGENA
jgi:hypothetical protein